MRLSISADGVALGAHLRGYIDRRLRFALGRFGPGIDHVAVRVADINGPRGGVDKRCQIIVKLRGSGRGRIAVDDCDENLYAAVARASARVGRSVGRTFDRMRRRRVLPRRGALRKEAE